MIPCGRRSTSDASGSFSWQAQYLVKYIEISFLACSMFIFRGSRNVL